MRIKTILSVFICFVLAAGSFSVSVFADESDPEAVLIEEEQHNDEPEIIKEEQQDGQPEVFKEEQQDGRPEIIEEEQQDGQPEIIEEEQQDDKPEIIKEEQQADRIEIIEEDQISDAEEAGGTDTEAVNNNEEKLLAEEDFSYEINEGKVTIKDYTGSDLDVVIPDTIGGYPVTDIAKFAFAYYSDLTSITIPESVTSIGYFAFDGCESLTSIIIPDSVTSIGDEAFNGCSGLTSITLPSGITKIGFSLFDGCGSLTSITIPDSVTLIDSYAFYECTGLTSITIPDSVTLIDSYAFYECSSLKSLTIPGSVTTIGGYAFNDCVSLTSVEISEGVTTIGNRAFKDCDNLTNVSIPKSVTSIGNWAFGGCRNLTINYAGSICDYVKNIAYYADRIVCRNNSHQETISEIVKPGTAEEAGEVKYTCSECGLSYCLNYYKENGMASISGSSIPLFFVEIDLPSNIDDAEVKHIEDGAFYRCGNLTGITIPEGVTSIGNSAFNMCSSLTDITIPESVTSIGDRAFFACGRLADITIPEGVTGIGKWTFYNCGSLTDITIPEGVTSIGSNAFSRCGSLTGVSIPNSVKSIGDYAFQYCGSLTNVTIPDGLTSIGNSAFAGCSSLTSVTIPKSVKSIGEYAVGMYYSYASAEYLPIEGFIIYGITGSAAEEYAVENGLQFIDTRGVSTISLKAKTAVYSGKTINIDPAVVTGSTGKVTYTYYSDSACRNKAASHKNAGTYYVQATVAGDDNYQPATSEAVKFKISKADQSVTVKASAASVSAGKTAAITVTGAKGTKSFSSSNTAIAAVTSTGTITAKKVGTVSITVTADATDNYNKAEKKITIKVVPAAASALTATNLIKGISIKWKKVAGATGYYLYRDNKLIKTITDGSTVKYADAAANTNGTKYVYKLAAYAKTGKSTLSKSVTKYRLESPAVSSLENSPAGKATVKWGTNEKGTGYELQYSTVKDFSSRKKVSVTNKNTDSTVISGLTKGRTYYVRISTYKTVNGTKHYSAWSAVKSVTITH